MCESWGQRQINTYGFKIIYLVMYNIAIWPMITERNNVFFPVSHIFSCKSYILIISSDVSRANGMTRVLILDNELLYSHLLELRYINFYSSSRTCSSFPIEYLTYYCILCAPVLLKFVIPTSDVAQYSYTISIKVPMISALCNAWSYSGCTCCYCTRQCSMEG